MASSMSQADSRKLRAIYNALDSHNNKQALKLIKTFLERHSGSQLGMALSALALEREGRAVEAGQALDKLLALKPKDAHVINTAAPALKALGRHDDLTKLWEAAALADASNEDLQVQFFLTLGRANAHSKQYQHATEMYKTFKRPRYLFWMAGASYLQWRASNGKDALQLMLAEKWAAKAAEESAAPNAEAIAPTVLLETVLFTVELQEAAKKFPAALQTLTQHAALFRSEPALLQRMRASLLTRLARPGEARECYKQILESAADDYEAASALIASNTDKSKAKEHEEEMRALFASLSQRAPEARLRGVLLASVLLSVTALEQSPPSASSISSLSAALKAYLAHITGRPCILVDLSPLLTRAVSILPTSELAPIAEALATAGSAAVELAQILPMPIEQLPASLHPPALSLASARRLLSQYLSVPAEKRHEAIGVLVGAIAAATAAYQADPIARITILLLKLYQLAGAGTLASHQASALSPKHIQWLTLPYLYLDETVELVTPIAAAQDAFKGVAKFIADSRRDMPDLAGLPFRHDSFSKLREFARMREKLERSIAGPEAAIDAALLSLSETPSIGPASVLIHTIAAFAAPLTSDDVALLEIHSDRSVLPAVSALASEQTALLAARHAAPEAWRRALLVLRSTVGPFLRLLSGTPTADQINAMKAPVTAALALLEAAATPTLQKHPLHRSSRLLAQLLDLSLLMLGAKEEEADEALSSALNALNESQVQGLAAWQATHGWWSGDRLGAARRWQAEESTWCVLAWQSWIKLVPRKAKGARTALRKTHAQTQERLGRAIEALQWVEWKGLVSGVESKDGAGQALVAIEGAQKSALTALRQALGNLRSALQEAKP